MNLAKITTPENLKALGLALLLAFVSTVICLILAYPLAMILVGRNVNQSSFVVLVFILPMWMNFLLRTLAWQNLLEKNGVIQLCSPFLRAASWNIINTPTAIILGMVYNFLPFMVLPIYNVLVKIDKDVISAARDLVPEISRHLPRSSFRLVFRVSSVESLWYLYLHLQPSSFPISSVEARSF